MSEHDDPLLIAIFEQMIQELALAIVELNRYSELETRTYNNHQELVDEINLHKKDLENKIADMELEIKATISQIDGKYSTKNSVQDKAISELTNFKLRVETRIETYAKVGGVLFSVISLWLSYISIHGSF